MAEDMKKFRKMIDEIDDRILKLYEERMDIVRSIGSYKMANNLPVYDAAREDAKLEEEFPKVTTKVYASAAAQMQEEMMGVSYDGYDDFNWDGEPVGIELDFGGDDDVR